MNLLPSITDPSRVAIVEECPGLPGQEWLAWLMDSLGHPLDRCMRGYLSAGKALARDLVVWKPNVVVCMGDEVLRAFHPDPGAKATAWHGSLWRGSLLLGGRRGEAQAAELLVGLQSESPPAPPLGGTHSESPSGEGGNASLAVAETACLPSGSPESTGAIQQGEIPAPVQSAQLTSLKGMPVASAAAIADTAPASPRPVLDAEPSMVKVNALTNAGGRTAVANTATGATFKCLCTLHPSNSQLRLSEWSPLLKFDLRRALEEATNPDLTLPERHIAWNLSFDETMGRLEALRGHPTPLGHDLEGWPGTGVTDFSFATSPTEAFWVPIRHTSWAKWWMEEEEAAILAATKAILEDPGVGKVCHNGASECFTWRWAHGIKLRGLADDSMLAFHELYAELEKNLSTVASLLTRQPYWGEAKDQSTPQERATYNCLDSMLSLEVSQAIKALPEWTPSLESHYRHRLALVQAALDQELRGVRLDLATRSSLVESLNSAILEAQGDLDRFAGIQAPTLREVTEVVCAKKAWGKVASWDDVVPNANPSWLKRATQLIPLLLLLCGCGKPGKTGQDAAWGARFESLGDKPITITVESPERSRLLLFDYPTNHHPAQSVNASPNFTLTPEWTNFVVTICPESKMQFGLAPWIAVTNRGDCMEYTIHPGPTNAGKWVWVPKEPAP